MSEDKKPTKKAAPKKTKTPKRRQPLNQATIDKLKVIQKLEKVDLDEDASKKNKIRRLKELRDQLSDNLKPQQLLFVKEYFKDFNITQAGLRAGYSKSHATGGERIIGQVGIKEYIKIMQKINELELGVTGEFVVNEFNKLAKIKASDLYYKEGDKQGQLIPPHELPDEIAAAIQQVNEKTTLLPNGTKIIEFTYKLHSKVAALDALGKHTGIYERDNRQKKPDIMEPVVHVYLPENGREVKSND